MIQASMRLLRHGRNLEHNASSSCHRSLTTTLLARSGHNRWSKIKHDKANTDAAKSKQRTTLAKEIANASKAHGPDPDGNPHLAGAIAAAKRASFTKSSIDAAIARGQGRSSTGAALEPFTFEAVIPPGIGLIVDCETDSKARTLQDLRLLVKNYGGNQTPTAYLFQKRGRITFQESGDNVRIDEVFGAAMDAGPVENVTEDEEGRVMIDTVPEAVKDVEEAVLKELSLEVKSSEVMWCPNEETLFQDATPQALVELNRLYNELQEYPGIQGVSLNIDLDG